MPALRSAFAFGGAFLGASFLSIVIFDRRAGPALVDAPLLGLLSAVVFFFCLIYYPAAYAGAAAWTHQMLTHMSFWQASRSCSSSPMVAARRGAPDAGVRRILIRRLGGS